MPSEGFPKTEQVYPEGSCTNESPLTQLPKPHFCSLEKSKAFQGCPVLSNIYHHLCPDAVLTASILLPHEHALRTHQQMKLGGLLALAAGGSFGSDPERGPFQSSTNSWTMENKMIHFVHNFFLKEYWND